LRVGAAAGIDFPFVASMVTGVGIVQQTLQLVTGANLLHFDFVPSLDRVWVAAPNFSVAEGEVAPADGVARLWALCSEKWRCLGRTARSN
jgi:hypothetical protein